MAISHEICQLSMTKINMKISDLKYHWNLPGANEFTHWCWYDIRWHFQKYGFQWQNLTITRGYGSLTRPKQPCVSPIVTADVTKGRTEIFKFDAQRIICGPAAPYATRPCSMLKTSAVLIYYKIYLAQCHVGKWLMITVIIWWKLSEWNWRYLEDVISLL